MEKSKGVEMKSGGRWRHHTGRIYVFIFIANEESTKPEYPPTVVYKGISNGKIWTRPLSDWSRSFTKL
jgi:hypothetical protein